jgi:hypothetical protein
MGSMNNKPIAWINEYDGLESFNPDNRQDWIPVYTHPAKTLTDEEITDLFRASSDHVEFARAILRKAQGD